jgi:hypothetical protein
VNGSQAAGVTVERSRTGLRAGVEVEVRRGSNRVGEIVGRLWAGLIGVQDMRIDREIRRTNAHFIKVNCFSSRVFPDTVRQDGARSNPRLLRRLLLRAFGMAFSLLDP